VRFTARYPGRCGLCDNAVEPGEDCTYVDDEVVHTACAREAGELDPDDGGST
jgi:hypothetical protein